MKRLFSFLLIFTLAMPLVGVVGCNKKTDDNKSPAADDGMGEQPPPGDAGDPAGGGDAPK